MEVVKIQHFWALPHYMKQFLESLQLYSWRNFMTQSKGDNGDKVLTVSSGS